jgi:hypothetical protein
MNSSHRIAVFREDVTAPVGSPLCAGWKDPAVGVADPCYAMGVVVLGAGDPIVLCAVDWCEISNRSHIRWREKLAAAAGTTADRVAVQTTHPHCTPWPDEEAQEIMEAVESGRDVMDPVFCAGAIDRVAAQVGKCLATAQPLTHIATGRARVDRVASNRRVMGDDGKVKAVRWTVTPDPEVRAAPEGLIDPFLKTLSLWNNDRKVASLHYYAVHNTSYDNDLVVTPDFLGLARDRFNEEDPDTLHIFFNECAGNITAGKYNDGARENRELFTKRIHDAMVASEQDAEPVPVQSVSWRVKDVHLPPRADLTGDELLALASGRADVRKRSTWAAIRLAGLRRQDIPIPFGCLHIDDTACVLHLPGETFIEYQLYAQEKSRARFTAVPSYGDCGPGYICLDRSYEEGGYEPRDSFVAPGVEEVMKEAIRELVG